MWINSKLVCIVFLCFEISTGNSIGTQDLNGLNRNVCPKVRNYIVINGLARSFFGAWRFCTSIGMKFATITSANDSLLVEAAIQQSGSPKGPWWIGGTDLGMEGSFIWISTNNHVGRTTGYFNFSPGQPDNNRGNEHCLEIGRWGGVAWNDLPCDWLQGFICEFEV